MMLLIPITAILQSSSPQASAITLRHAAARRRLLFGTCIGAGFLSEPDYAEVAGREFSQAEPENEMKFSSLHPRPDTDPKPYDFTGADAIVAYAAAHKMKVRGHCFVWNQQVSRWVAPSTRTPEEMAKILQSHIQTVAEHFAGKVYAWDVVNEAFVDNGSLRHTLWFDRPGIGFADKGTGYIEQALRWAHAADRRAKLFYNDYSCETVNKKSDAIYAMVADFKKRRVPIDGVGFQMHLDLRSNNPQTLDSIKENFRRFGALGVQVQITEMDVSLPNDTPEMLAQEADLYRSVVAICLGEPMCTAIQTWGFTDKHSWIPMYTNRARGWALPFDEKYQPKPAYTAILEALTEKG